MRPQPRSSATVARRAISRLPTPFWRAASATKMSSRNSGRLPEPGREPCVEQRHPDRLAAALGDQRLEARVGAETVPAEIGLAGDHCPRGLLENRQLADEMEDEAAIGLGRETDLDHRSRHSRAPLPGGPKSRGARPAWNQV